MKGLLNQMDVSLKERTISSLIWKFLERAGNQLVLLLVQIVMARILTPTDFGVIAIILVFINLANVFIQSGLGTALVQSESATEADYSTVFWISFAISFVLFVALYFFAPAVSIAYAEPRLTWPLRILSLTLLINAYNSVQIAVVQRSLQFDRTFKATAWSVCISGALGIVSALLGFGIWALIVQQLFYQSVNCVSLYIQTRWIPKFEFGLSRAKELYSFGWKILASNLLNQGYLSLYDLVVGAQFSVGQLGLVSQGKKYPSALGSMLDGAIQPVMMSAVSRVQSDLPSVKRLTRRALKTSTFVIVPCMTLFAVAAKPVVLILLGNKWLMCVPFLQIYCFVYALLPIHSSNLSALCGMGRSDINFLLEIIKKLLGMTALCFGAFVFNNIYVLVGSALFTGVIGTFINSFPNKSIIGYSYLEQLKDIGPSFIFSLFAGFCALFAGSFFSNPHLAILIECLIMGILYLGLSKAFHLEAFEYLINTARDLISAKCH